MSTLQDCGGFLLQKEPRIYVSHLPGRWLLERATPSWRVRDPEQGFQRLINEDRARKIALAVIEQGRTFPNAIVLATDKIEFQEHNGHLLIPPETRFMVVDGQHRLWAQNFSDKEIEYCCMIHMGLDAEGMARLFLEINDNQKRVPSSLRWDLVRLVESKEDTPQLLAAELVYELATQTDSPLYQRIDLTGEQKEILLKQGSIAPEIKRLTSSRGLPNRSFEEYYHLLEQFFLAIRELDADGWGSPDSVFYKARVLRALLQLMPAVVRDVGDSDRIDFETFLVYLGRINPDTLHPDVIRASQGSAGIKAIADEIREQIFANGAYA